MHNAETVFRQVKEAEDEGRLDNNGHALLVNECGIPYEYKPTFLMKIRHFLYNLMYESK